MRNKRALLLFFLFVMLAGISSLYAQDNPEPDYTLLDKRVAECVALAKHDEDALKKISADLLAIFMSLEDGHAMGWFLQRVIHGIDEVATLLEHEALLVEIGLNYVKGNEKLIFYKNVLKSRLEQYRKEIHTSFDLLNNNTYLMTDDAILRLLDQAKEIIGQTIEAHDRCIEVLRTGIGNETF